MNILLDTTNKEHFNKGKRRTEAQKITLSLAHKGKFLGERSCNWRGGRVVKPSGHVLIKLTPDSFFYIMARSDGYVYEHRLVMAQYLGRCLHPFEIVHHKNHDRQDNRIENLQLVSDDRHNQITILENKINRQQALIDKLQARITLLEAEKVLISA